MKKLFIALFTLLSASLTTAVNADQGEDVLALLELERDYMMLVSREKRAERNKGNVTDEPECD